MEPRWDRDAIPSPVSFFLWAPLYEDLPPHLGFREAPPKRCDSANTTTVVRRMPGLEEHPSGCLVQALSHRKRRGGKYRDGETTIQVAADRLGKDQRKGQVLSITFRSESYEIEGNRIPAAEFARLKTEWKLSDPPGTPTAAYPKVVVERTHWHKSLAKALEAEGAKSLLGTRLYVQRYRPTAAERAQLKEGRSLDSDPDRVTAIQIRGERTTSGIRFQLEIERPVGSESRTTLRYDYGLDGHLVALESVAIDGETRVEIAARVSEGYLIGKRVQRRGKLVLESRSFHETWRGHAPKSLVMLVFPMILGDTPRTFKLQSLSDLDGFPFFAGQVTGSGELRYTRYPLPKKATRLELRGAGIQLPRRGVDEVLVTRQFALDEYDTGRRVFWNSAASFLAGRRLIGFADTPRLLHLVDEPWQASYGFVFNSVDPKSRGPLRLEPAVLAAGRRATQERRERSAMMLLGSIQIAENTFRERDAEHDGQRDFAQSLAELRTAGLLETLPGDKAHGYRFQLYPSAKDPQRRFRILAAPLSGKGPHLVLTEASFYRSDGPIELSGDGPLPSSLKKAD